ncbi:MAG: MarR family winged helix-turn-helix transcriptional regulator, partial [Coriobacteriales bacterium]
MSTNIKSTKNFFDACRIAGRIRQSMPPLPNGVSPRHVHVVDAITQLSKDGSEVRVSDVSELLGVTRPGITRAISELEELDMVEKAQGQKDGRTVIVQLTSKGKQLYTKYVKEYFEDVTQAISGIDSSRL